MTHLGGFIGRSGQRCAATCAAEIRKGGVDWVDLVALKLSTTFCNTVLGAMLMHPAQVLHTLTGIPGLLVNATKRPR